MIENNSENLKEKRIISNNYSKTLNVKRDINKHLSITKKSTVNTLNYEANMTVNSNTNSSPFGINNYKLQYDLIKKEEIDKLKKTATIKISIERKNTKVKKSKYDKENIISDKISNKINQNKNIFTKTLEENNEEITQSNHKKKVRFDSYGIEIIKNSKKHKVTFADEKIKGKSIFIEIIKVKSFKKYNFLRSNSTNSKVNCKCNSGLCITF